MFDSLRLPLAERRLLAHRGDAAGEEELRLRFSTVEGAPCGSGGLRKVVDAGAELYLQDSGSHQDPGLSAEAVRLLLGVARQLRLKLVWVYVPVQDATTLALFEAFEFVRSGRRSSEDSLPGGPGDEFCLQLELGSSAEELAASPDLTAAPTMVDVSPEVAKAEEALARERRFLEPALRQDSVRLEGLLHRDFVHFDLSGKSVTRCDFIEALQGEDPLEPRASGEMTVRHCGVESVLLTYEFTMDGEISLRSSLWAQSEGLWRLSFHQATARVHTES